MQYSREKAEVLFNSFYQVTPSDDDTPVANVIYRKDPNDKKNSIIILYDKKAAVLVESISENETKTYEVNKIPSWPLLAWEELQELYSIFTELLSDDSQA